MTDDTAPTGSAPTRDGASPAPTDPSPDPDAGSAAHSLPWWACLLIGIGGALVGLLPWLTTGMRLPLQNLWAQETASEDMPLTLLPFSQYSLAVIFGLLTIGAVATGIAARALTERLPRGGFALIMLGLLAVQTAAIAQTALVTRAGLQDRTVSAIYVGGLVAVCVISLLVGVVAVLLIARAPRAGALLGLTIGAIAVPSWAGAFLLPLLVTGRDWLYVVTDLFVWLPAVLVGVAIAWAGVGTVGRVLAALVALAILWVAPAAMTAVSYAAGSRVLANDPVEMIDAAADVFVMALLTPEIALRPLAIAVAVAVVGLIARIVIARARRSRDVAR